MPISPSYHDYDDALDTLSKASVHKHFDAFVDIAWDDEEFKVDPTDPRWKLPSVDPLGSHPWYLAQSQERQIEIGLLRQANIAKIGTHFENALMRGLLQHVQGLPNGSREFRYCLHEVTEETHHTQMFQEFVNRTGVDVAGAPWWFRLLGSTTPVLAMLAPEYFFLMVLLGEEPLDHVQKQVLRADEELHPLLKRIMQIHVAEEARHISFAHEFLDSHFHEMHPLRRAALTVGFPLLAKIMADVIARPSNEFLKQAGIPKDVVEELYKRDADAQAVIIEMFSDVRFFAEKLGVLNKVTRPLWNLLGVGGRPSRHRGEVRSAHAA